MSVYEWGSELPRLSGRRLDLRWLTPGDATAIFGVFGDPEVTRYWSSPPLPDLAAASHLIGEIHQLFDSRHLFQWGVCDRKTDEVFGTCTLLNLDLEHRHAEIGFAVGRSVWGQGLASEAVNVLIAFAFESLDVHRLEADVDPRNTGSIRLLERQGFHREGLLRERWHLLGEVHDSIFLGLLRREWVGKQP